MRVGWVLAVVGDKTWIGGKPANRHGHKRDRGGQGVTDKTPVVSLIHAETGEVRSKVVTNVSGKTLRSLLRAQAKIDETTLHTDTVSAYGTFTDEQAGHDAVNHSGEYRQARFHQQG